MRKLLLALFCSAALVAGCEKATEPAQVPDYKYDALQRALEANANGPQRSVVYFGYWDATGKWHVERVSAEFGQPPQRPGIMAPSAAADYWYNGPWDCNPSQEITCWCWWDATGQFHTRCDFGACVPSHGLD